MQDKPDFDTNLLWYWTSFRELSSDRRLDNGEIPFSSVDRYCKRWGIETPGEFDEFNRFIRAMDKVYLEEVSKKLQAGLKKVNK